MKTNINNDAARPSHYEYWWSSLLLLLLYLQKCWP